MHMETRLREVREEDYPNILALNHQALPYVNPMDAKLLKWFAKSAAYFRVLESDGRMAGFLIAVAHDSRYASKYFEWFRERYECFLYIDRVIVASWARRRRFAWRLYEDVARFAAERKYPLASDVYSFPPNEPSLEFHRKFGFERVGVHEIEGGKKQVAKFLISP